VAVVSISDDDLDPVIQAQRHDVLRSQWQWPVGAILAAVVLFPLSSHLGAVAMGAALAWSWGLAVELRQVRPRCLAYYAPLKDPFQVEVSESGIQFHGTLGEALLRWEGLAGVVNYPSAFLVESDNENAALLPKRCLSSSEILLLESRSKGRREWAPKLGGAA
jgi:hypothetical protein